MNNICCWRKDIIIAKKFCAASECIAGPSTATAGYEGAEKGVERAHYLPPARGFGNMQPSRPQPRWQRSYLHTQCLVLPPSPPSPWGPAQRWPRRFAGDGARRSGTLLSASAPPGPAHRPPRPRSCPGLPPAPRWDTLREAAKKTQLGVYGEQALFEIRTSPHHKSLQALACLQNPGETERSAEAQQPH